MDTMRQNAEDRWNTARASEPSRGKPGKFTDVHCHCLPALDDGPESSAEALALCRLLADDNVGCVVATPHQLGGFEGRTDPDTVRSAIRRLDRELSDEGLDLRILPGGEVRLDERICALLAEEGILTLADRNRHILLELPQDVFIDIEPLIVQLVSGGIYPIIAHAERNAPLCKRRRTIRQWLTIGASLQVTAASLAGYFGPRVHHAAWSLIAEGTVAVVATDAHGCDAVGPCMTAAFEMIAAGFGETLASLLCIENPSRVLDGKDLIHAHSRNRQEVW